MRTENKNIKQDPKYTVVLQKYIDQCTYKFIAIYKFKKDIYRFIYQNSYSGRKSGIYKLSNIGWILIETDDVIIYHENVNTNILSANTSRASLNMKKEREYRTIYLSNEFFKACQRYIDFLMS